MPANLTPDYRNAEAAYRAAKSVPEKMAALEQMFATIPKHKGTEKMQADIKRRLAKLRQTASESRAKGGIDLFHVEKHGAGQVALVGAANAGKSALVGAVTKARVTVAPYPLATHGPVPGMLDFEDVQIQLVDLPPVRDDGFPTGMINTVRNADVIVVCLDLAARDLLSQAELCQGLLDARGVVDAVAEVPEGGLAVRRVYVGTKLDAPDAVDNLSALKELRPDLEGLLPVSAERGDGLEALGPRLFEALNVIRVYSKEPGKAADMEAPFVLPAGSTVLDLAREIHREIAEGLRRARIWGSEKYDGQPVQRDHVLADKDVIELHV